MRISIWAAVLGLILATRAGAADAIDATATHILRNTYYYVVLEAIYVGQPLDATIRDLKGETIAQVSTAFRKAVDIEGTGRLTDGRVINFAGRIDREIRYFISDSHYGYGVGTCWLQPFRTVAVDPTVVPLGSLVYIAETKGMRVPGADDELIHDGYWRADDVGGAIKKDRIDLFIGDGDHGEILRAAGIQNLKPLTVRVVEPPAPDTCARQSR